MSIIKNICLENLGYNGFFESSRIRLGFSAYPVARVFAQYRQAYKVRSANGQYSAKITGKQMFNAKSYDDYPAVGDWVAISELEGNNAVIRGILPRTSILKKKYSNKQENQIIATNIDTAFIVESMDRNYNLNRVERFLVLASEGGIHATIILNKIDLISEEELKSRVIQIKKRFAGIEFIVTSTVSQQGIYNLEEYITVGKTYCFLGSSGVGKSSLINKLLGKDEIKTREISVTLQKGMHTTTTREMYFMQKGGLLIDNPGTREVGIASSDTGIENVFDEIAFLAQNCKFSDCSHTNEPGCAVQNAIKNNVLDSDKFNNYRTLKKESDFYTLTDVQKREKDRKFGKYVKSVLKDLKH